jgi:glutamyl-tRNA(Gln) amidotransferase subunit D
MEKDRILLVYTGGTIGGRREENDTITDDLIPRLFLTKIYSRFPDLAEEVTIEIITPIKKFSEDFAPMDWIFISRAISDSLEKEIYTGIVIAHGTDTLCYTAAALSFIDFGHKLPICVTGSNFPIADTESDAPRNFSDSIFVARQKNLHGVFVVFSGIPQKGSLIHHGNWVKKVRFNDNCFESINFPTLGKVGQSLLSKNPTLELNRDKERISELYTNKRLPQKVNDKVALLKVHPGFDPDIIVHMVKNKLTLGIILELYNSGTACTMTSKYSLIPALEYAKGKKIPVFATSQHIGSVRMDTYGTSIDLKNAGVIPLKDMLSETALVKLMLTLGNTKDYDEVVNIMKTSIAGEISE